MDKRKLRPFRQAHEDPRVEKIVTDFNKRLRRRKIKKIAKQIFVGSAVTAAVVIPVVYVWQKKNNPTPEDNVIYPDA